MNKTRFYPASTLILILASSAPAVYAATSTGAQSLGSAVGATDTFDLFCPAGTSKAQAYVQDTLTTNNSGAIVRASIVKLGGAADMRDDTNPAPNGEGGSTSASAQQLGVTAYTLAFIKLTSSSSESYTGYARCYNGSTEVGVTSLTRRQNQ